MFTQRAKNIINQNYRYKNPSTNERYDKAQTIEDFIVEEDSAFYIAECPHRKYIIDFFFRDLSDLIEDELTEYGRNKILDFEEKIYIFGDSNEFKYNHKFERKMSEYFWFIMAFIDNKYSLFETGIIIQSLLWDERMQEVEGKFAVLFNSFIREFMYKKNEGGECICLINKESSKNPHVFCQGNKYISWFFEKFLETFGHLLLKEELRNYQLLYHFVSLRIITNYTVKNHLHSPKDEYYKKLKRIAKLFYQFCEE